MGLQYDLRSKSAIRSTPACKNALTRRQKRWYIPDIGLAQKRIAQSFLRVYYVVPVGDGVGDLKTQESESTKPNGAN